MILIGRRINIYR